VSRPQPPPRRRAKALALLALATSIAVSGVVVLLVAGLWPSPQQPGAVGFDWTVMTPDRVQLARAMRAQNKTLDQIAATLGVGRSTVTRALGCSGC